ncbi:protein translocase subunit SecD [Propylenella binzhouense]|uniref:Protein translocase subunit SecD n=1 Tax=Propylenella binzhouense TaxID=2555902 RepID=A0A964WSV4_9HYPH|nr:protein translocase subunit SecD [Propylenella binzhouense]MYZ47362.1 protein translocase subunit SecD [Propylenella binzhouense]
MLYFQRWKIALILAVVLAGAIAALPNLFPASSVANWPSWLPNRQIVLGLDLRGGAHLLLEVERDSLIKDRLETLTSDVRQTLRDARIGYRSLAARDRTVSFTLRDAADGDRAVTALNPLAAPIPGGLFGGATVSEVSIAREGEQIRLSLTDDGIEARVRSAVEQSLSVLGRRLNALGTTEPTIQREGEDRILVQVPGLEDTSRLKEVLGQTARMTFHLECPEGNITDALQTRPPPGCEIAQPLNAGDGPVLIESRARLSGDDLVDAQPGFDQQTHQPIVTFRFNTRGATVFGDLTQQNVGRRFAVVLDEKVITAPVIRSPILGGTGQIEGNFTVESAQNLSVLLRAGALPADLTIVEERTVGPSLGRDSIAAGEIAAVIGSAGVVVFMVVAYGLLGVFAVIALVANVILLFGSLTALGATLTLPGIAGIVLTMGMAVDSNVLIYERIREEARLGRSTISAIEAGFSRAFATILDSNITTLIAALALFALGSGPIRGFAVTLAIGILTTMFTAYLLTRLIVAIWVRSRRPKAVPL